MSTMKERLARAHFAKGEEIRRRADHEPRLWEDENVCRSLHFDLIAAILAELKNPSEEMISAMLRGFHLNEDPRVAMRDALVNGLCFVETEGCGAQIPIEGVVNAGERPT